MAESTYTYDRASFAERAAKLAGMTTFREPVGGRGTKHDHVPDEHAIATCFAFARQGPNDIGPDIALAVATGCIAHADRIVRELAVAILSGMGLRGEGHPAAILRVAAGCYLRAMGQSATAKPDGITDRQYQLAALLGDSVLWQQANEALFRAERAYRSEGSHRVESSPETRLQSSCT